MTGAVAVRRADLADAERVGRTLADAFVDDPVFRWLIPVGASHREKRLQLFFTSMARSYLRRDKTVHLVGDGQAAALWSAPGSWELASTEVAREARDAIRAFGRHLGRALRVQNQIESLHPKEPAHWYLGYLGTRTIDQGNGLGSAILSTVLADADRDGLPAYLESSCERNLSLYRRHGFEVVEQLSVLGEGPSIWRMWREPRH